MILRGDLNCFSVELDRRLELLLSHSLVTSSLFQVGLLIEFDLIFLGGENLL